MFYAKSNKDRDFLVLCEPIKVGHHSEKRHRKMIDDAWNNMGKSVEMQKKSDKHASKAAYWKSRAKDINLSMPESIEYFQTMLEVAKEDHRKLKSGEIERDHDYSLTYAKKRVNDLTEKYQKAIKLWSTEGLEETTMEKRQRSKQERKEDIQTRLQALVDEAGAFYAFSNKQFAAKAVDGVDYCNCGMGLVAPVDKAKQLMLDIINLK